MATNPPPPAFSFTVPPSLSGFSVPMNTYLTTHDQHESAIATGALVFDAQDRVLLVQRAAHDSMPNRWEIPGGAVDHDDATILHGVARELWEESGLKVKSVGKQVGDAYIFFMRGGLRIVKFTFVVEVETTENVSLDANEHQKYLWASEEECSSGRVVGECSERMDIKFIFPAQRAAVLEGFRLRKENEEGKLE
jgi:8-oxo-dGTP pyrophosphatase MutT (NUDIX family)